MLVTVEQFSASCCEVSSGCPNPDPVRHEVRVHRFSLVWIKHHSGGAWCFGHDFCGWCATQLLHSLLLWQLAVRFGKGSMLLLLSLVLCACFLRFGAVDVLNERGRLGQRRGGVVVLVVRRRV